MSTSSPVLLVGAGSMGRFYARVLAELGVAYECLGRGAASAEKFHAETGVRPTTGPLADQLAGRDIRGSDVIVAVNVAELEDVCHMLLDAGARRLLVEKPGAVDMPAIERLTDYDRERRIRIAYNRRFFPSTREAAEIVRKDGGAQTLHFTFTELSDRIAQAAVHPPHVLANWYLANSSHVFDMAFVVAGARENLDDVVIAGARAAGKLDWHPKGARFVGCGSFGNAALYSYSADWQSGGGWSVEVTTAHRKLRLQPLEKLFLQQRNTFEVTEAPLSASEPAALKPGLYGMVTDFLENDGAGLPDIAKHRNRMRVFDTMLAAGN